MQFDNQKFNELVEFYKTSFLEHWEDEKYKWVAVKWFQEHFDIEAPDFSEMFKDAIGKTVNLLASVNNFPGSQIINFAKEYKEETRSMFRSLYDETMDLQTRIDEFKQESIEIVAKHNNANPDNLWGQSFQNENAISTYLWLQFPDKYYIYKYSEYKAVAEELNVQTKFTKGKKENVINGFAMYDEICNRISTDTQIRNLLQGSLTDDCYQDTMLKTLTIDFGFHISRYFDKTKKTTDRLWMWNKSDIWNDGVAAFSTNILKMGDSAQGKLDFATIETKDDLRIAYQAIVENTDVVIPNMYWQFMHEVQQNDIVVVFETIKEGGKLNHLLYGWGRFTSDCKIVATDNNPLQREVEWHLPPLSEPVKETTTSNSIYFHLVEGTEATNIKKLLGIDVNKSYWLLSWNPDNWEWKNYDDCCRKTKSGGTHIEPHTCHSTKPRIGDEVFLMKTGKKEPKGIIAHGTVVKESYTAPHYDSDKAEQGVTKAYIDASYDCILNYKTEPILER